MDNFSNTPKPIVYNHHRFLFALVCTMEDAQYNIAPVLFFACIADYKKQAQIFSATDIAVAFSSRND